MTKFTVGNNRVLVLPDEPDTKMGSLLISEWRRVTPCHGTVIGTGRLSEGYETYEPGTRVHWIKQHNGFVVDFGGKLHIILHQENILGHIPEVKYNPETTTVA